MSIIIQLPSFLLVSLITQSLLLAVPLASLTLVLALVVIKKEQEWRLHGCNPSCSVNTGGILLSLQAIKSAWMCRAARQPIMHFCDCVPIPSVRKNKLLAPIIHSCLRSSFESAVNILLYLLTFMHKQMHQSSGADCSAAICKVATGQLDVVEELYSLYTLETEQPVAADDKTSSSSCFIKGVESLLSSKFDPISSEFWWGGGFQEVIQEKQS